jgi:hypothetical protein
MLVPLLFVLVHPMRRGTVNTTCAAPAPTKVQELINALLEVFDSQTPERQTTLLSVRAYFFSFVSEG